jgi:hypothetical protein
MISGPRLEDFLSISISAENISGIWCTEAEEELALSLISGSTTVGIAKHLRLGRAAGR